MDNYYLLDFPWVIKSGENVVEWIATYLFYHLYENYRN